MLTRKQYNKLILQELRKRRKCKYNNVFITEEAKENVLDLSQGTVKVL